MKCTVYSRHTPVCHQTVPSIDPRTRWHRANRHSVYWLLLQDESTTSRDIQTTFRLSQIDVFLPRQVHGTMYMRNGHDTSGSIDFISRVRFFMLIAYVQFSFNVFYFFLRYFPSQFITTYVRSWIIVRVKK